MPTPLLLVRLPGPPAPTLCCRGDLTLATSEALRRELASLIAGPCEALVVDCCGLCRCDTEAAVVIAEAGRELLRRGGRFVLVTGDPEPWCDAALPIAATPDQAARLLADGRGG